jgi:hypothetical protein
MTPIGPQLAQAYAHEQKKKTDKHLGKWEQMELPFNNHISKNKDQQFPPHKNPFDYGNSESKVDVKSKIKKRVQEDREAILKLEEELWNS